MSDLADALNEHLYGQGEAPKADIAADTSETVTTLPAGTYFSRYGAVYRLLEDATVAHSATQALIIEAHPADKAEDMPEATETVAESARRIFNP